VELLIKKMETLDDRASVSKMILASEHGKLLRHYERKDGIDDPDHNHIKFANILRSVVGIEEHASSLQDIMAETGTEYSYTNFWLCFENNSLVGFLQGYEPNSIDIKEALKTYDKAFDSTAYNKMYREWRRTMKPLVSIGLSARIHEIYFVEDYGWNDVGKALAQKFCDDMNYMNFDSVFVDVLSYDDKSIAFYKRLGFNPTRVITSDVFTKSYLRMVLHLDKKVVYSHNMNLRSLSDRPR
jgi:ribosomal protein S18 acetylase RimI-like enzyme